MQYMCYTACLCVVDCSTLVIVIILYDGDDRNDDGCDDDDDDCGDDVSRRPGSRSTE